jgi:16S rRNA (cytosine1402-N4)-methyltransferase
MTVHKPVLLQEVIEGLELKNGDTVVDATLGGGGHSLAILEKILPQGKLIAIDQDKEAIASFRKRIEGLKPKLKEENFEIVHNNFANLGEILFSLEIPCADAIVADLGISSDQLEKGERGFSFQKDEELDMRMDASKGITAEEVVNTYPEEDLVRLLEKYGEEDYAKKIAQAIVRERVEKPIKTTNELVKIIEGAVPERYKHQRINFSTKTFQALRLEVNQELESLVKFLDDAIRMLVPKGRLAIISFHSGEDAIVKSVFRENARGCICPPNFPVCRCGKVPIVKIINSRPIVAGDEEIKANPRSRSAKLRIIEKI